MPCLQLYNKTMLQQKLNVIIKKLEPNILDSKYLLAVSGGRDSVALAHLLKQNKIQFSIAHCNFKLRGEESDREEEFVKELCEKLQITFFVKQFNTELFALKNKLSIQEAARNLRYNWFFELLEKENFAKIITAHHANDDVETFLINLQRGSGIRGLAAITDKNKKVLRPLLQISSKEIDEYVSLNDIGFKEDSSNSSDKYLRNSIRLKLLPYLNQNFPDLVKGIENSLPILKENKLLFEIFIREKEEKLLIEKDNIFEIKIKDLLDNKHPLLILFEILKKFGFTKSDIENCFNSIVASETKHFFSENFELIKSRQSLFIQTKQNKNNSTEIYKIDSNVKELTNPIPLFFNIIDIKNIEKNTTDKSVQLLDYDKLIYPLILRKPMLGDKFKPLGMKGFKKLSDYFIDNKFSKIEKQNTWVVESNLKIVCVLGHRISDDFKIMLSSKKALQIHII